VRQNKPDNSKSREWLRPVGFLFTVGWYVALSLLIPTGIGFWLDQPGQFDSKPLYTLIGFGIGTVIAFYGLFRLLKRFYLEQKEPDKNRKKENT
jgi:hypothetical protein